MSFAVEAALARGAEASKFQILAAHKTRMVARPACQRVLAKGEGALMA
jgi:glutathione S-transferase